MKILLIMSMILLTVLTAEVKGTFYTNRLTSFTLGEGETKATCFDKYNGSILDARLAIFHDVFFPVTNCMYSNMFKNLNIQQVHILDLEIKLEKTKKYNRKMFFIGMGTGVGLIIIPVVLIKIFAN